MSDRIAPKLLAEFIGTFAFVFIGAGTAVTVGVLAAGAMGVGEAIGYIVSQFIGGIVGALFLSAVQGGAETGLGTPALAQNLALGATTLTITPAAGFMIEAVLGFFLVTVVLGTAVVGRAGNVAPLAIGMTLTFNILMGGALTGAPFNPARALGPMVATGNFSDAWLYLTAPILGAIVAAILHISLARLAQERAATGLDSAPGHPPNESTSRPIRRGLCSGRRPRGPQMKLRSQIGLKQPELVR